MGKADKRKSGEIQTAFQGVRPCVLKYMIEQDRKQLDEKDVDARRSQRRNWSAFTEHPLTIATTVITVL